MGLIVQVYRHKNQDCTNDGISSKADSLTIVNIPGPFEPTEDAPAAILEKSHTDVLRVVEAVKHKGKWQPTNRWAMMGGNYAATSDSRFSQKCEELLDCGFYGAVAIHDRYE